MKNPTLDRYCTVSNWDPCVKARQRSSPSNHRALTSHFSYHGRAVSRISSSHRSAHHRAQRTTRHFCICSACSHTVSSRTGSEQHRNKCRLQLRQQSRLQFLDAGTARDRPKSQVSSEDQSAAFTDDREKWAGSKPRA